MIRDRWVRLDQCPQHLGLNMRHCAIGQLAAILGSHQVIDLNRIVQLPLLHLSPEPVKVFVLGIMNQRVVVRQVVTQFFLNRDPQKDYLVETQGTLQVLRSHVGVHEFCSTVGMRDDISLLYPVALIEIDEDLAQLPHLGMVAGIVIPVDEYLNQRVLLTVPIAADSDMMMRRNPDGHHLLSNVPLLIILDQVIIGNGIAAPARNQQGWHL